MGRQRQRIRSMDPANARAFRIQLQSARQAALGDSEAFEEIIHSIERIGSYLHPNGSSLGDYKTVIVDLANNSPLSGGDRAYTTPFPLLYDLVKNARNDALHIGAFARHLTTHAVQIALVLEDALRMKEINDPEVVADYMIRDPICGQAWEPISFIRQRMLANSFSFLPLRVSDGWKLISDISVAKYLRGVSGSDRRCRLAVQVGESDLALQRPPYLLERDTLDKALESVSNMPALVLRDEKHFELVGILSAFDLL